MAAAGTASTFGRLYIITRTLAANSIIDWGLRSHCNSFGTAVAADIPTVTHIPLLNPMR